MAPPDDRPGHRAEGSRLRLAGSGRSGDSIVSWSVADGSRGRRWRSIRTWQGRLVSALVLELGETERILRLELSTPAGMLTLHPDGDDARLHGNVVTPAGVRHVAQPWSSRHVLLLDEPIAEIALLAAQSREVGEEEVERPVVSVDLALAVEPGLWLVRREADGRLRLRNRAIPDVHRFAAVSEDGRPGLDEATTWPLELD